MKIGYCAPACYIREVKEAGFDYIELPLCSIAAETDQSFEKILAQLKSENLPCLASNMFLPKNRPGHRKRCKSENRRSLLRNSPVTGTKAWKPGGSPRQLRGKKRSRRLPHGKSLEAV